MARPVLRLASISNLANILFEMDRLQEVGIMGEELSEALPVFRCAGKASARGGTREAVGNAGLQAAAALHHCSVL